MKVTLLVRAPKKPEKRIVVERDVVIGRGKGCNLQVLSNDVSRQHCRLAISEFGVAVRDLGSGNGTLINSQKTEPNVDAPLISGDIVRIGPLVIKVEFEAATSQPVEQEPTESSLAAASLQAEAQPPPEEPASKDAAELTESKPEVEQLLEPDAADELLPDEDSSVNELAGADSAVLTTEEPVVEDAVEAVQQPGKIKSLFGLFGRKKPEHEAASKEGVETVDANPASESDIAAAEPLLVAGNADFVEETVVFDPGNAFTPDEGDMELLVDDDEDLSDEGDYLDDEVGETKVDPGFTDFLNNVDPPPT
ncbi:MAG: FHA domain-containing protein [Planctomycetales bacterium]|jgi:pSer/pThr/pTyr-binding forkhead associated (FHA) protein